MESSYEMRKCHLFRRKKKLKENLIKLKMFKKLGEFISAESN